MRWFFLFFPFSFVFFLCSTHTHTHKHIHIYTQRGRQGRKGGREGGIYVCVCDYRDRRGFFPIPWDFFGRIESNNKIWSPGRGPGRGAGRGLRGMGGRFLCTTRRIGMVIGCRKNGKYPGLKGRLEKEIFRGDSTGGRRGGEDEVGGCVLMGVAMGPVGGLTDCAAFCERGGCMLTKEDLGSQLWRMGLGA
jgi:hypothetical protein